MRQTIFSGVRCPAIYGWVKPTHPRIIRPDPHLCAININRSHLVASKSILRCIGSPSLCFIIINGHTTIGSKPYPLAINSDAADFIARQTIFCCDRFPCILTDVVFAHTTPRADPHIFFAASDTPNLIRNQ